MAEHLGEWHLALLIESIPFIVRRGYTYRQLDAEEDHASNPEGTEAKLAGYQVDLSMQKLT
jgi:hypothetical protein